MLSPHFQMRRVMFVSLFALLLTAPLQLRQFVIAERANVYILDIDRGALAASIATYILHTGSYTQQNGKLWDRIFLGDLSFFACSRLPLELLNN